MQASWLTFLYDYNRWANRRLLRTAAALSPDEFLAPVEPGGSLRDILAHTMATQWLWLSRWQGTSPRAAWNAVEFPDLAAVRERWEDVERDTATFIAGLSEARLSGDVTYTSTYGPRRTLPLWQLMLHQANHATQHRSEAAYLLTQAGHSPGNLDLFLFMLR